MEYTNELIADLKLNKDISSKLVKIKKEKSSWNIVFVNTLIVIYRELISSQKYKKFIISTCALICEHLRYEKANRNKILTTIHGLLGSALMENDYVHIEKFIQYSLPSDDDEVDSAEFRKIYTAFFARTNNKIVTDLWQNRYTKETDIAFLINFTISTIKFGIYANRGDVVVIGKIYPIIKKIHSAVVRKNLSEDHFNLFLEKILQFLFTQTFKASKHEETKNAAMFILELFALMSINQKKRSQRNLDLFYSFLNRLGLKSFIYYINLFDEIIEICGKSKDLNDKNLNHIFQRINIETNDTSNEIFFRLSNVLVEVFKSDFSLYNIKTLNNLSLLGKILFYCFKNLATMQIEKCNCNEKCSLFKSHINGASLQLYYTSFVYGFFEKNSTCDIKIVKQIENAVFCLQKIFNKANCDKMKVCFKNIVLQYENVFRAIVKCELNTENTTFVLGMAKKFSLLLYEIKDTFDRSKFKDLMHSHLYLIFQFSMTLQEYKMALSPMALATADFGFEKDFKTHWHIAKSKIKVLKLNNILDVTIVDVLSTDYEELKSLKADYNVEHYDLEKVAMLELECFEKNWPDSQCLAIALKSVLEHTNDIFIKAKAFNIISKSLSIYTDKYLEEQLNFVLEHFISISETKTECTDIESKLLLANLYALKYFYGYYLQRGEKLQNTIRLKKDHDKEKFAMNQFEFSMLKNLDKCIEIYTNVYNSLTNEHSEHISLLTSYNSVKLIEIIANFYLVHNYEISFITTSILCYKYAQLTQNYSVQLSQLASLIENINYNLPLWIKITKTATKLIQTMREENLIDPEELEINFLISKSQSLYLSNQYQAGYQLLKEIEKSFEDKLTKNEMIEIRIELLKMYYFSLPCNFTIEGHQRILRKGHEMYRRLKKLSFSKYNLDVGPKNIVNLMNFLLFWGKLFEKLYLPREAKYFLKQVIEFTSQAGLSLRSAQTLSALCEIDLQISNVDDCKVKLEEIENILSKYNVEGSNEQIKFDNSLFALKNVCAHTKVIRSKIDIVNEKSLVPSNGYLSQLKAGNQKEQFLLLNLHLPSLLDINCSSDDLVLCKESELQFKYQFALNTAYALYQNNKYKECMQILKFLFSLFNNNKERVNNILVKAIELVTVLLHIEKESNNLDNKNIAIRKQFEDINDSNYLLKTPKVELPISKAVTSTRPNKFFKSRTPAASLIKGETNFTIYSTGKDLLKPSQNPSGLSPRQNYDRLNSPHVLPCKTTEEGIHKDITARKKLFLKSKNDEENSKTLVTVKNKNYKSTNSALKISKLLEDDDLVKLDLDSNSDSSGNSQDLRRRNTKRDVRVTHLKNQVSKKIVTNTSTENSELVSPKILPENKKITRKVRSRTELVNDLTEQVEKAIKNMEISENADSKSGVSPVKTVTVEPETRKLLSRRVKNSKSEESLDPAAEPPTVPQNAEATEMEEEKPKRKVRKKKNPFIL